MVKKNRKEKARKYILTLSEAEMYRLTAYAEADGVERPVALHRLVSQGLRKFSLASADQIDKRQLGLFDAVQIDIFNPPPLYPLHKEDTKEEEK